MALTTCPDCEHQISTSAAACPQCGRPMQSAKPEGAAGDGCPHCGSTHSVARVAGLHGGSEVLICVLLVFFFLIPGVIYYIVQEAVPYCASCGRRVTKDDLRRQEAETTPVAPALR